jgi:hypothetical protein
MTEAAAPRAMRARETAFVAPQKDQVQEERGWPM